MVEQPLQVADSALAIFREVLASDATDLVVVGCTTIAACLEEAITADPRYADIPFINPSTLALIGAEGLVSLRRRGRYRVSREGFYQSHREVNPAEARDLSARFHLTDASGVELALVGDGVRIAAPNATGAPSDRSPVPIER